MSINDLTRWSVDFLHYVDPTGLESYLIRSNIAKALFSMTNTLPESLTKWAIICIINNYVVALENKY